MEAAILTNPGAGQGEGLEAAKKLADRLRPRYDQIQMLVIDEDHDPVSLAMEAAEKHVDDLFVIGGDGTLNAAVEAFADLEHRPTIGLLPGGTNNTFARLLGSPADLNDAIDTLPFERRANLDIGRIGDRFFAYYLAFGKLIDASMNTKSSEKELLGSLAYVKNIVANLPDDKTFGLRIRCDDEVWEGQASHVYVINSTTYGSLDFSTVRNELNNGRANVFILQDDSLLAKLSTAADMIVGQVEENPNIITMRGQRVEIEPLDPSVRIQTDLDGQEGPDLPVTIEMLKEHQPFFVTDQTPLL